MAARNFVCLHFLFASRKTASGFFVATLQTARNFSPRDGRRGSCRSGLGAWSASPL